jgi:hypothetical protein
VHTNRVKEAVACTFSAPSSDDQASDAKVSVEFVFRLAATAMPALHGSNWKKYIYTKRGILTQDQDLAGQMQ